ncbi:MAG: NAD(P)H-dependent glycerol-3-phosphate dehydrogenase [Rickettsiaceae bacterium]|nr:NAD(P)H-dependent glycerol-3-phosphate dehydrogenase [Rickettsiaceae bacterium]MCP5378687.1 NAD(P)H-dependent glycerol-3-phosphate dehydrogenase [Rickettsiaceae bacterium]
MNNFRKFAVVGSGSWGSAIAAHLARMHELVVIYSDSKEVADEINNKKTNSRYLESVTLPPNLVATDNIAEVTNSEVIFIVVPSHAFGNVLEEMKKYSLPLTTIFVIATKGISSNPLELLSERFRRHFANPFAFFSGPNFAKEVALGKFSSATVSSPDLTLANNLAQKLSTPNFEISTTEDIITVQISSLVKNMVAIKSGILEASGAGENARAWLITKALQEILHISSIIGGKPETLLEPAVVGDLILTSYSKTSRNTKFGFELHQNNYSQSFISSYSTLVEGVEAAKLVKPFLLKYNIKLSDLPIINSVVEALQKVNS